MSESARLFLALWPDAAIRSAIAAAAAGIGFGGRATAESNLHVTLAFLGEVDAERRACLCEALGSVQGSEFELTLSQVRWRRRGGIVWLAPAEIPEPLVQLVRSLAVGLRACGLAVDERRYRPHVTIARDANRAPRPRNPPAPIRWSVREYCLVRSTLSRGGSSYAVVRRWSLT